MGDGPLADGERYEALRAEYGAVAELQQVCALQIHVAVGDSARTIAVHDALREHLPDLAALAANAPVYGARDTGFASVRPLISRLLPRQGVPPAIGDPHAHAADLAWGAQAGAVRDPTQWWWELRPHPVHGTLELRVPDAQTSLGGATAIVALAYALVATVADELDTGVPRSAVPSWRIEENRWAACRDGLGATVTDVRTGEREAVADRLLGLVDRVRPAAVRLGCAAELTKVSALVVSGGGAAAQRREAFAHGIAALPGRLADRYLDDGV
ncbi:MAG: glutamate-cysteine ligase family protein [Baekduiaceae bacterium]